LNIFDINRESTWNCLIYMYKYFYVYLLYFIMDLEKNIYTKEQVNNHIDNHNIAVDWYKKMISQCIDWRYLPEDNEAVSIPWADTGELQVMMVTLKQLLKDRELSIEDVEILEKILIDVVGGVDNLRFHTDDHNHHNWWIWCWHLRLWNEFPHEYNLLKSEMEMVNSFMKKSISQWAKNVILTWHHGEKAVFIVDSASHAICSQDKDGNQVFIYHKTFAEQRNWIIANEMKQKVPELISNNEITENIITDRLNAIMENHLSKTSWKLAKWLPIYKVIINNEGKDIQYLWLVE